MTYQSVPLSSLQPPAANPRTAIDPATLDGLAASIAADGLLQNLVVTPARGKRYRIVSGERRYRALKLLEERGVLTADYAVPVEIRSKLGKDDRLRLATVENVQREDLPPLDEAVAFAKLVRKGVALDDIAAKTGLSPATIKRRLALNSLCQEAQAALSEGEITLSQAEALTVGSHDDQRGMLEALMRGYDYDVDDIRHTLLDRKPTVAMAIFPVAQYTGTFTTDLFAEEETTYFDDVAQFFALQKAAVEALAEGYRETAAWVEVTEHYSLRDWVYRAAEDGEESGVLVNFSPAGMVEIREGLVRPDMDEDTAEAIAEPDGPVRKPKPSYPRPLCAYIAHHKSTAVQEMLLADPRKAKEVAAVRALAAFVPHEGVQQLAGAEEPQSAYAALESQARLYAAWLGFEIDEDQAFWTQFPPRPCDVRAIYQAVKALSDHELDGLHTLLTALQFGQGDCDRLDTGDTLFNRLAGDLAVDMRNHWQPDRAFLNRRTKDQLVTIAEESGFADGHSGLKSWKKSELVAALHRFVDQARCAAEPNDAQRKARAWLPGAMQFPAIDPDARTDDDDSPSEAA